VSAQRDDIRVVRRVRNFVRDRTGPISEAPILVFGNAKAGTSAIAHLLADYGSLSKQIDVPPLWAPRGQTIMRGDVAFAEVVKRNRRYFSAELIKEPFMTFFAGQVLDFFPRSKAVFVVRDPRENIRSMLNRRKIPGHLEELDPALLPQEAKYQILVDAEVWGGADENYVGILAHRWNLAVDNCFRRRDRMVVARYEDFLEDKSGFIARLAVPLGIVGKNDISHEVDVQFQPAGVRGVPPVEFLGPANLARIERICADRMPLFGYEAHCLDPAAPHGSAEMTDALS
jgi:hypothetical protein